MTDRFMYTYLLHSTVPCLLLLTVCFSSCEDGMNLTMEIAESNDIELQKVLDRYDKEGVDKLKCKSARFLVANMTAHYTTSSPAVDAFAHKINCADTITGDSLNVWWKDVSKHDKNERQYDAQTLTAEYISDNIEKALDVWKSASWKGEISTDIFLRYVLPYRLCDEPLSPIGWRDSLYKQYSPLIKDVKDVKKAYAVVYNSIMASFRMKPVKGFSYLFNALEAGRLGRGSCINRCAYIGAVMRSLGIPAVVDGTVRWANYSKAGHSWVSLVLDDGTYTVAKGDTVPRKFNPIDSSVFNLKYTVADDYPMPLDFKKRTAKVWRSEYEYAAVSDYEDKFADKDVQAHFLNPFYSDVSAEYGLDTEVEIKSNDKSLLCYLCTFSTGDDWKPVCYAKRWHGKYTFKDVADSVVYLPMAFDRNGVLRPLSEPFLATKQGVRYMTPNLREQRKVTLTRKYPFARIFVKSWVEAQDSYFEASNRRDFNNADTLYKIVDTPIFQNDVSFTHPKAYRYIRYVSHPERRTPVTEIMFFSRGHQLQGTPLCLGAENTAKCFDGDTFSYMDKLEIGYSVGMDFGKPVAVDSIAFFLVNDGNFVVPNDEYELFYYDRAWHSLGKKKAETFSVVYDKVPSNALLLLRDNSRGEEERIFTYENGKQLWW